MPRKKIGKKSAGRGRKKRYNKKKSGNKVTTTIVKTPGFSDQCYVKLKYAEELHVYDSISHLMNYTFRGNSCYDPNYTGIGHQPMYYDQYSLIYNRYRVMGCKIKVNLINKSAGAAAYVVLQSGTDHSVSTTMTELLEQSRAHICKTIPVASRYPVVIKGYTSTRKALGLNKKQIFDEDFSALTTTNPQQLWYQNLQFQSVDAATLVDVYAMVSVTYYVQFFDRKNMTQS